MLGTGDLQAGFGIVEIAAAGQLGTDQRTQPLDLATGLGDAGARGGKVGLGAGGGVAVGLRIDREQRLAGLDASPFDVVAFLEDATHAGADLDFAGAMYPGRILEFEGQIGGPQ